MAIIKQPSVWRNGATGAEVETSFATGRRRTDEHAYEEVLGREPKWSAWKVTLVVVVFCAAFWSGVGYIAMRLLG